MEPELKKKYREEIRPALMKERGYKNVHEVPAIEKVVINSGLDASLDKSQIEDTVKDISAITGQKAVLTKARTSISNFKVREGMPLGVKVTLRGNLMYDFLYRLIAVALPSIRDFRGVPSKCDGLGNYTLGITDHTIFPEISIEQVRRTTGMDVTIVTSAQTDDEARLLLEKLKMPFRKRTTAATAA